MAQQRRNRQACHEIQEEDHQDFYCLPENETPAVESIYPSATERFIQRYSRMQGHV